MLEKPALPHGGCQDLTFRPEGAGGGESPNILVWPRLMEHWRNWYFIHLIFSMLIMTLWLCSKLFFWQLSEASNAYSQVFENNAIRSWTCLRVESKKLGERLRSNRKSIHLGSFASSAAVSEMCIVAIFHPVVLNHSPGQYLKPTYIINMFGLQGYQHILLFSSLRTSSCLRKNPQSSIDCWIVTWYQVDSAVRMARHFSLGPKNQSASNLIQSATDILLIIPKVAAKGVRVIVSSTWDWPK